MPLKVRPSDTLACNCNLARYTHRFDTCIVCIQQGDGGIITKYRGGGGGRYMYVYVVS